jgi:hypothetical protein
LKNNLKEINSMKTAKEALISLGAGFVGEHKIVDICPNKIFVESMRYSMEETLIPLFCLTILKRNPEFFSETEIERELNIVGRKGMSKIHFALVLDVLSSSGIEAFVIIAAALEKSNYKWIRGSEISERTAKTLDQLTLLKKEKNLKFVKKLTGLSFPELGTLSENKIFLNLNQMQNGELQNSFLNKRKCSCGQIRRNFLARELSELCNTKPVWDLLPQNRVSICSGLKCKAKSRAAIYKADKRVKDSYQRLVRNFIYDIKKGQGLKTGKEVATVLGITPCYLTMIKSGKQPSSRLLKDMRQLASQDLLD